MARPRKPTALHLLQGTARADRINSREPQPQRKRPQCPPHISDGAKVQWRHFAQLLDDMGVLTEADGPALAALSIPASSCRAIVQKDAPDLLARKLSYSTAEQRAKVIELRAQGLLYKDICELMNMPRGTPQSIVTAAVRTAAADDLDDEQPRGNPSTLAKGH